MEIALPERVSRPRRGEYTPRDFLAFREAETLSVSPKFQRRSVWKLPQKSYLIDTLVREFPIPPIYIRETQNERNTGMIREVIDGQQRLRAVLDYIDGNFAISRTLQVPWAGLKFEGLPSDAQARILDYHFSCEIFQGISDASVLDIFARMNTYSTPLNAQELRNGRYFGVFKQTSYRLAREYLQFWRRERVFTEQSIARMLEVELVGELLVMGSAGPQDKKASLSRYYADWDDEFPDAGRATKRFSSVMDEVGETLGEILPRSEFRRVPLFYSLFGAVYHRLYGVPSLKLATPASRLKREDRARLAETVEHLSDLVVAGRDDEVIPQKYQSFVTACLSQTDNIQPRLRRIEAIYSEAKLS